MFDLGERVYLSVCVCVCVCLIVSLFLKKKKKFGVDSKTLSLLSHSLLGYIK